MDSKQFSALCIIDDDLSRFTADEVEAAKAKMLKAIADREGKVAANLFAVVKHDPHIVELISMEPISRIGIVVRPRFDFPLPDFRAIFRWSPIKCGDFAKEKRRPETGGAP